MLSRDDIIKKAHELDFEDIGFTSAEPFESQREILKEREAEYAWTKAGGLDLMAGTDPKNVLPEARTIIVLMEVYFRKAYPRNMEAFFGRCYLDDDRITKDGLAVRVKAFRSFLREHGINAKIPFHIPHRLAAARAGMGTFGKNCLFYSNAVARQGSWVLPIAVVVDAEFEPGQPTLEVGCPDWCKSSCIVSCPTGALKGPRKIDPRRCISYLTYFGSGLTPREFREPMGLYVYGCDRCQNVCPRNAPWLAADLVENERVTNKSSAFQLEKLLHMDPPYFEQRIWPHMFYMPSSDIWRWKMNVARSMGNTRDTKYVPELARAFEENDDERVRAMCAWAIGRIGGPAARSVLESIRPRSEGVVAEEVDYALEMCK
ncbi:MAG: epoxyqueuosine reductase [Desulfomonile tiedjei]|nr:epoxyqueuosine reductase [Desulfomonile tiedjei]